MKTIVLGAGIVGVATAWYLAKSGHEVDVIERQPAAGLETSWGQWLRHSRERSRTLVAAGDAA